MMPMSATFNPPDPRTCPSTMPADQGPVQPEPTIGFTPLQLLFLARLKDLCRLRQTTAVLPIAPAMLRLIDFAIYSTYCDCRALAVGDEAELILARLRR